jgi:hypothetical protein
MRGEANNAAGRKTRMGRTAERIKNFGAINLIQGGQSSLIVPVFDCLKGFSKIVLMVKDLQTSVFEKQISH